MTHNAEIVEKLSQFNNLSFSKKQWEIILKGCGCPKSPYLWIALKSNLQKNNRMFTLIDINTESFNKIWNEYCSLNRANNHKAYNKAKARKRAEERKKSFTGYKLYLVNGCLTDIIPTRDEY